VSNKQDTCFTEFDHTEWWAGYQ